MVMKMRKVSEVAVGGALACSALLVSAVPAFAASTDPAAPAAPPAPAASTAPAAPAKGCTSGELPPVVLGSPQVKPHQAMGVYLWHGPHGYALRVTEATSKRLVVTGTITVSGDISKVQAVRNEKDDSIKVDGQTLTFRFVNYGGIDGVNFAAECSKTVQVALRSDGHALAPTSVFLGSHRQHPTSVPFAVERAHDGSPAQLS
jgi:hypothetical protein